MELRPYQKKAIDAIYNYWSHYEGNPLVILPTGTGKSIVIAEFVRGAINAWPDTRIIIATHSRELVKQNYLELCELWPMAPAGLYSAGLNRKDTSHQIIFCGIQSAAKKAFEFQRCDILIIDEAHTVSEDEDTLWNKFISDLLIINPDMKVLGLTATAFRMKSGSLIDGSNNSDKKPLFTDIAYEYSILDAVKSGWLSPIIPKSMTTEFDVSGVHKRGGEFIAGELERAVNIDAITKKAIDEVLHYGQNRKTWLLFCSGVDHSNAVADELISRGIECAVVTGNTPTAERDEILRRFKAGELRAVANNNVMTTGTNIPCIDLIAGLRPTGSAGLHIQMLGRGMRLFNTKENCLYLDFAKNVSRFGPLDKIRPKKPGKGDGEAPVKVCEHILDNGNPCSTVCFAGVRVCPDCGNPFPEPEVKIKSTGDSEAILSNQIIPEWHDVDWVTYAKHEKPGKIPSLRVTYGTMTDRFSEWICFEHTGFARDKAVLWHKARSAGPIPKTIAEALEIKYQEPLKIEVIQDGKYFRIRKYDFDVQDDTDEEEVEITF